MAVCEPEAAGRAPAPGVPMRRVAWGGDCRPKRSGGRREDGFLGLREEAPSRAAGKKLGDPPLRLVRTRRQPFPARQAHERGRAGAAWLQGRGYPWRFRPYRPRESGIDRSLPCPGQSRSCLCEVRARSPHAWHFDLPRGQSRARRCASASEAPATPIRRATRRLLACHTRMAAGHSIHGQTDQGTVDR